MNKRLRAGLIGLPFILIAILAALGLEMGVKRAAYLHTYGNQNPLFKTLYIRIPGRWTFSGHGIPTLHQKYETYKIDLPLEDTVRTHNKPTIYPYEKLTAYSSNDIFEDKNKYIVPLGSGEVSFFWERQEVVIRLKNSQDQAVAANGTYPLIKGYPPVCESC